MSHLRSCLYLLSSCSSLWLCACSGDAATSGDMQGTDTPDTSSTGGDAPGSGGSFEPAPGSGGSETGGSFATGGQAATGGQSGTGGDAGTSCQGLGNILSKEQFEAWFPNRNSAYTYQGLLDAVSGAGDLIGFSNFASGPDCDANKREVAAFLANVSRETGALYYIEQINQSADYCDESKAYGCPAGTYEYFGRGPIQLSWNYNYRAASLALFGDDRLLSNPDLVAQDSAVAWAAGFWFWMNAGQTTCHTTMQTDKGFGYTIRTINGGEECDGGYQSYASEAVSQRVCYYEKYTAGLGTTVGAGDLNCNTTVDRGAYCNGI